MSDRKEAKARAAKAEANANVRRVNYSNSPLLASRTPPWRSKFLVALVGAGFVVLLGRAAYVQVIGADFFLKQGEIRYAHTLVLPARRGHIVDRNGLLLATSVPAPSIWVIPKDFEADAAERKKLAGLLNMTPKELANRLDDNPNFVWLRRQIDEDAARQIEAMKLKGLAQVREYMRKYPQGEAAAHVVGFTNIEDKGQEGVELGSQGALAGKNGSRRVIKDRLGRVVEDIGESVQPADGKDVQLSIDSQIQAFAYQKVRDAVAEHKAKAGSVVVLDAQTGEILALANYPSFNPSDRRNLTGAQLRNRAITDVFEPGSTMKPIVASIGMELGRITPDSILDTAPGRINLYGATITDTHQHGNISVFETIKISSNIGAARISQKLSAEEMWDTYSNLGFGQKPQIGFPGAVTGRLRPWKTWRPIEKATMSYGYGLSASLLQIAHAYTVFAHDGEVIPVTLEKNNHPADHVPGIRIFGPKTIHDIRGMLQAAAGPGGTGPRAQMIGYSVGGKSGTAYKQEGKGYDTKKYRAWFTGLAPISNPRIICAVMVDEPSGAAHYGGDVAAPVFSQVVSQTLRSMNVPPDIDVKPDIVTNKVPATEESF